MKLPCFAAHSTQWLVRGLVLALLVSGCRHVGPPVEVVEGEPLSPEIIAKLQSVLEQDAAFEKAPGMVMAVQIGNSQPWIGVTGYQDEAKTLPMTARDRFRVGSITKNFVGMAILQQVDEGKVRLDDTLEKWLPGVFPNIDGTKITIQQMLNHTSGIETYTEAFSWNETMVEDPLHVWNAPDELLALAKVQRDESIAKGKVIPPGSIFAYSNTNFILLGMIIAKADGAPVKDWYAVIQKRFFQRLAMSSSSIPAIGDPQLGSTNHGYVNFYNFYKQGETSQCSALTPPCKNEDIDYTQQEMSNAWSAGAIISDAADLLKWINAEVKGDLLSAGTRAKQQAFIDTCSPEIQVGLAMFRQTKYGFIGHRGEIFGFNGTIQYLPEKDMTVVVLANRTALDGNHVGPVPEDVAAALYPELQPQTWTKPSFCP